MRVNDRLFSRFGLVMLPPTSNIMILAETVTRILHDFTIGVAASQG